MKSKILTYPEIIMDVVKKNILVYKYSKHQMNITMKEQFIWFKIIYDETSYTYLVHSVAYLDDILICHTPKLELALIVILSKYYIYLKDIWDNQLPETKDKNK